jgi:hypothetical protein
MCFSRIRRCAKWLTCVDHYHRAVEIDTVYFFLFSPLTCVLLITLEG